MTDNLKTALSYLEFMAANRMDEAFASRTNVIRD